MKYLLLLLLPLCFVGCAKDEKGKTMGPWQTLKKWDQSLNTTEARLQGKRYAD